MWAARYIGTLALLPWDSSTSKVPVPHILGNILLLFAFYLESRWLCLYATPRTP